MFTIKIRPIVDDSGKPTGGYRWYLFDTGFPVNESNNWPVEGSEAYTLRIAVFDATKALLARYV